MCAIPDADVLAVKGATDACYVLGGGVTSFALLGNRAVSTLVKYGSVSLEFRDHVIPLHIAIAADRRAGSPIIIEEAARQLGYRLERMETTPQQVRRLTDADAVNVALEAGDAVQAIHEAATRTGDLDELSRKRISKELHELKRAADNVLAAIARAG